MRARLPGNKCAVHVRRATRQGWTGNGLFAEVPDSITRELGLSGRQVEAVLTTVEQRIEDMKNILLLYSGQ